MTEIIIAVTKDLENRLYLQELLEDFEKRGFIIEVFPIESNLINISSLPQLVEFILNKYQENTKLSISVLSNVKELLFSWYRCYNNSGNSYIYAIDLNDGNKFHYLEDALIEQLSNFNGVDNENLRGKIYINLNESNYKLIIDFLMMNRNYYYFEKLDNFFERELSSFCFKNKTYKLDDLVYSFSTEYLPNNLKDKNSIVEIVRIYSNTVSTQQKNPIECISSFIAPYLIFNNFLKSGVSDEIQKIFMYLRSLDLHIKEIILDIVNRLILIEQLSFKDKVKIYSLLAFLGVPTSFINKKIMELMVVDSNNSEYYHNILVQLAFYINNENMQRDDAYEINKRKVLLGLIKQYNLPIKSEINIKEKQQENHIVIITDQLLNLNHSPTMVTLEYAYNITKLDSNSKVTIVVEDNFLSRDDEILFIYPYKSEASVQCKNVHLEYIQNKNIEIIYSDPTSKKHIRTEKLVNQVMEINPRLILSNSEASISLEYLYKYYPVLYLSFGTVVPSCSADLYLFKDKKEAMEENIKKLLIPVHKIEQFTGAISIPKQTKVIERHDLGFADNDFLVVTVGNRLVMEISRELVNMMGELLKVDKGIKWLIVGLSNLPLINEIINRENLDQVRYLRYESDLFALYKACDVYLNPIRHGGGYSIVIAMAAGLPIVISNMSSDGLVYVGEDNGSGNSIEDMFNDLLKLYQNDIYRKEKGDVMRSRLNHFSEEKLLKEFQLFFERIEKEYEKRRIENK